jgi:aspartate/methionine/tyrosine aminotransferase
MIMPGGKPTMFAAITMFGEPGTEILYPDPGFPIYRSMIDYTGAKAIAVPIREENDFAFSAEETLSKITPATRLLIINSPANPTGGVTPKSEIDKLVAGLEAHPQVAILSDEIYDVMTYDGETHTSLLTWAMTGWRMGWSNWPNGPESADLYDKVRKLAVNCWSCVNAPSQFAGIAAIDGPQDDVDTMLAAFDRRRQLVTQRLNALDNVHCATPKGAFYAFPNISATGFKAKDLASRLLEEAGVALVGGPDFGAFGEGFIRLSCAASEQQIADAITRVQKFLDNNSGVS